MTKRLVIPVEFSQVDEEEINMYLKLKGMKKPGIIIKNILLGNIPVSILKKGELID